MQPPTTRKQNVCETKETIFGGFLQKTQNAPRDWKIHGETIPRGCPLVKRSLLRQVCPPIGLALLLAFGLIVVAIPILLVRLITAVAIDGIRLK